MAEIPVDGSNQRPDVCLIEVGIFVQLFFFVPVGIARVLVLLVAEAM